MSIKLYSAWYCPFAQRAWMALLLKQVDFEYIEVDPYQESDWWQKISRGHNLVPVLVTRDDDSTKEATIVDSSRVLEYLDECYSDILPFLPDNLEQRAEARYWMDHINQAIVPYLYRFLEAQEPGDYRDESRVALTAGVKTLFEANAYAHPYLGGERPGLLDLSLIPFAYRIDALLGHYRGFALPAEGEVWQRYQAWYDLMSVHPVFIGSKTHGEDYSQRLIEHYLPYSLGEGQKDVTNLD